MLWASQIAVGAENGLRLRVFGENGSLEWAQENPNRMTLTQFGQPPQTLTPGGPGSPIDSGNWTRLPPGHPEGYLEGFATIYNDIADTFADTPGSAPLPGLRDGLDGMCFIAACLQSSQSGASFVDAT